MSRPLRIEFPGAYYHVMNRGLARQEVFSEASERELFLGLLGECHRMWGMSVLAYCLMDTHYHLFVQTPEGNLSRIMRHLDGVYTQRYNRGQRRDGPLFRGRYKAIVVDVEEYLLAVVRYIHRNPVEAKLVRSPEEYPWSSCPLYLEEKGRPKWLDVDQVLSRFPEKNRKRVLLDFMHSEDDVPTRAFYENEPQPVMGSKGFIEKIRRWMGRGEKDFKQIPEANRYLRPDVKVCLEAVGRVYGKEEATLRRTRRGERNEARAIAIYVCRKMGGLKEEEIARAFGVGGYSAVSSMIGRTEAKIKRGGEIVMRLKRINELLQR
jgi:putative transposase